MKKCLIFLIGLVNVNAFFNPLKQTINIYEARKRRVEDDYFDNFYDDYEEVQPVQTMKDLFIPKSERQEQYYNDIWDLYHHILLLQNMKQMPFFIKLLENLK